MFNIGFTELILILLVAFVIVGPRDLPKIARALGRGVRMLKNFLKEFQEETGLGEVVDEFKRTSRDLERTMKENDPTVELKEVRKEIEDAVRGAKEAGEEVMNEIKSQEDIKR